MYLIDYLRCFHTLNRQVLNNWPIKYLFTTLTKANYTNNSQHWSLSVHCFVIITGDVLACRAWLISSEIFANLFWYKYHPEITKLSQQGHYTAQISEVIHGNAWVLYSHSSLSTEMFVLIHQRELFHLVHPSPDHSLTHWNTK